MPIPSFHASASDYFRRPTDSVACRDLRGPPSGLGSLRRGRRSTGTVPACSPKASGPRPSTGSPAGVRSEAPVLLAPPCWSSPRCSTCWSNPYWHLAESLGSDRPGPPVGHFGRCSSTAELRSDRGAPSARGSCRAGRQPPFGVPTVGRGVFFAAGEGLRGDQDRRLRRDRRERGGAADDIPDRAIAVGVRPGWSASRRRGGPRRTDRGIVRAASPSGQGSRRRCVDHPLNR